jgi:hypothetical protein
VTACTSVKFTFSVWVAVSFNITTTSGRFAVVSVAVKPVTAFANVAALDLVWLTLGVRVTISQNLASLLGRLGCFALLASFPPPYKSRIALTDIGSL